MNLTTLNHAIEFATIAHQGQCRKGTNIPYITHPFAVAMMLMKAGCQEEVIIAGLLHDVVEDTAITADQIRNIFGDAVAEIVAACSENKNLEWEDRKQHTIDHLKTAPMGVKQVTCADKLHNISTMLKDYENCGEDLWERFNPGREGFTKRENQQWYYSSLAAIFEEDDSTVHPMSKSFTEAVNKLFT